MTKPNDFIKHCTVVSPDGAYWRVVTVTKDSVSFSGPGPCRSIKTVAAGDLDGWVPIVPL